MNRKVHDSRLRKFEQEALGHLNALLRAASRLTGSMTDAEDVVQETFLRAWKYFDSFETGTNCRTWLFRIMLNVINGRRGKQARMPESSLEAEEEAGTSFTNVVAFEPLKWIEGREVLEATGALTEEHRSVLWLVVVEEFSYKEVSDILGLPMGTVMSRLYRARRELRKLLQHGKGHAAAR